MPGVEQTELPLLSNDGLVKLGTKYVDWAPEPWSKLPPRPSPLGPVPGDSPPPLFRIMQLMGGLDGIVTSPRHRPAIERSFKSMKSKVWSGSVPVSDARWSSEALEERDNIEEALAVIQQVVNIFAYLRSPVVQGSLRDMYNHVWTELDIFHDAVRATHAANGDPGPDWDLSTLWQHYAHSHFQYVEHQARAWIFKRLLSLHTIWKDHLMQVMQSGRELNDTQMTVKIDHHALMILNKILDLYIEADIGVRIRTDGFNLAHGIHRRLVGAMDGKTPPEKLNRIYGQIETARSKALRKFLNSVLTQGEKVVGREHPVPSFMKPVARTMNREFAHKKCQLEFETPLTLKMESWVRDVSDDNTLRFGFMIYRISYAGSNEQWIEFLGRLEEGLNSGWVGIVGAESAKTKASLEWVDGRKHNIGEGDLDAVRKHFQSCTESDNFLPGLSKTVCLAITDQAVESFSRKGINARGFVYAVDSAFDTSKSTEQTSGYDGTFRIIDQLIWTDLYGLHVNKHCQNLNEFWSLATFHPDSLYTGPTTGVKRKKWRELREGLGAQKPSHEPIGESNEL